MWVEVLKLLNNHRIFYDNSESLIASELLEILKRCLLATASSSWILNKWSYWSCCNNSGIHMASPINTGNCYDSFYTALYACFKYRRNYEFLEILMKCKADSNYVVLFVWLNTYESPMSKLSVMVKFIYHGKSYLPW